MCIPLAGIVRLLSTKIFSVALIAGCVPFGWSAEDAKPPPDLIHSRTELLPTADAAKEWKEAEAVFTPIPEECKSDILVSWSLKGEKLDQSQAERLSKWIRANGTALGLIEKSLQKDRAQIPAWDSLQPMPYGVSLINLAKARLFLADQAATKGDHATATKLLLGNLKLSRLLRDAEVPVIHYLIAHSMRSMTDKAIARWARFANPDSKTIQSVLSDLSELTDEPAAYERILRVEFTDFILPSVDVKRLSQLWVEAARTNEFVLQMQPEELQRPLLVVHDPTLIELHPKPLDAEKQIRFYETRFRHYAANAKAKWNERGTTLGDQTEKIRTQLLADLKPLLKATKDAELPLKSTTARRVAKHYVKLDNPVGRFWQANEDSLARSHVRVFQARAERAATRTILAIRLYEIKNRNLPSRLDELVAAGFLPAVPIDPFSGESLHYSRDKRGVWSVGENGMDDGGNSGASFWQDKDAVWTLAPQ